MQKNTQYTAGQAACLIFAAPMTKKNSEKYLKRLTKAKMQPVYTTQPGERFPFALGNKAIALDPLKYHTYHDNGISSSPAAKASSASPSLSTASTNANLGETATYPNETATNADDTITNADDTITNADDIESPKATKEAVLDLANALFRHAQPPNPLLYKKVTVSNKDILGILARYLPDVKNVKANVFGQWLAMMPGAEPLQQKRGTKADLQKVRPLFMLLDKHHDKAAIELFNAPLFIKTVSHAPPHTIGYARKSFGRDATPATIVRLLEEMVKKLMNDCRCKKVFISPQCRAYSNIADRDTTKHPLLDRVRHIAGDAQGLLLYLKTCTEPIRLVIQHYSGLTTKASAVQEFVKACPQIDSIVVCHGHFYQAFSRAQLLHGDGAKAFECRTEFVQRSKLPRFANAF